MQALRTYLNKVNLDLFFGAEETSYFFLFREEQLYLSTSTAERDSEIEDLFTAGYLLVMPVQVLDKD